MRRLRLHPRGADSDGVSVDADGAISRRSAPITSTDRRASRSFKTRFDDPQAGYQIHHIVERQYFFTNEQSNARRFGDRLEKRDNLVRIPRWRRVEISSWYSRPNREYDERTPREFLRGKSWDEQYELGIQKLRDFGVLR
jgi:hypothetical protein